METLSGKRRNIRKRTGRRGVALTGPERRRLIQLGVSLAAFLLAVTGRSVFPEQVEQLNKTLLKTTDFKAAFSRFGEAATQGEPFVDAMGVLFDEVFADGADDEPIWVDRTEPKLVVRGRNPEDVISSWSDGGESIIDKLGRLTADEPILVEQMAAVTVETASFWKEDTDGNESVAAKRSVATLGLSSCVTPVEGKLTSAYGYRDHPVSGEYILHQGVDIGADSGAPVVSFSDGVVECVGESQESGLYLQIDHGNGIKTFYAHCSELYVQQGEAVSTGQTVAAVGESGNATGPHLHFSIIKDEEYLDPALYIQVG